MTQAGKGPQSNSLLEKVFKLSQNNTDVKTEFIAGLTTFMTMAYILAVNPILLGDPNVGMDKGALFTATALAAIIGTLVMGFLANYPFALAPGMGLNAYFVYTVCLKMGYSWKVALAAVFVEGIIFILLTFFNVREAIFNAIPQSMKHAVGAGIGLFITFIGLQNAKIIVDSATLVELGDVTDVVPFLAIVGTIITGILVVKKVKGSILIGIFTTYVLGIIAELTGWYVVDPEAGMLSLIPSSLFSGPPSIAPIAFKLDLSQIVSVNFLIVVFAFLFVDLFDTLGTLIGVSSQANMLDKDGKLPKIKQALFADAIATTAGALLGTSTTTTYVESAAGVAEGGRTGLTAVVTAIFFGIALLFSPIFLAVPGFATAPALIIVGFMMMQSVSKIDFTDAREGIPAFLTLVMMPLAYSISEGIVFGTISYVFINAVTGKAKKVHPLMYVLAVVFILKFIVSK
ncbi:NCS2 family permease [Defluviitalea phaphyphila]|uniref:NCS2 family permease n=1 Tax=Defluviitalea phaphyphila TaxID=1473580 RepID=UPI0007305A8D|nr:NCS2 family permease [Defluviitalea phaphyphila]